MAKLEEIVADATVEGVVAGRQVQIVHIKRFGADTLEVTFKDQAGNVGSTMVYREDEYKLTIVEKTRLYSLTAPGDLFRLASEARRIRLAHLFDPVLAVHISNIDPLPHQITAVYESMLPRQPLRFLLADDPGAGKTIMAGLFIKELIARGDIKRCLIVCPGSLVDQWQDELWGKFQIHFDIVTRNTIEESATGNPFLERNLVIARLDHLSRNEDVQEKLAQTDWDLIICDEAHKMSASFTGDEIKYTKRYQLGQMLGGISRHFLLMSATPHNGKEADFQLFLALLDGDRFEGKFRDGVHQVDVSDLMRRLIKEKLLTFDGRPLFPERRAYTVEYTLSDLEAQLYSQVTTYVREEMNRADAIDGQRGNLVGFALTALQRRLASSPEAIYQSLVRRRDRLQSRLNEARLVEKGQMLAKGSDVNAVPDFDTDDDEDLSATELEALEGKVVDFASAAQTVRELELEIGTLDRLEKLAQQVRQSGTDRKWDELSRLLEDDEMFDAQGHRRKLIIFTEQRDTLRYLHQRIGSLLGREEAIVEIHGGMGREDRRKVQEEFRNNPEVEILLATDAAGEGVNLQRAHLMVNYDLPWNPNRIEQRFGRIHRIGQTEVCHLWNLVASGTREGDVYLTLLRKLEEERKALGGQVFDVLGQLFTEQPLRKLLIEAIRDGERPEIRAKLYQQVEGALDRDRLIDLMSKNALVDDAMDISQVVRIRDEMDRALAMRMQPHFIADFFLEAFQHLGGSIYRRESGRFEITHVPPILRDRDRLIGRGVAISSKYERVTFDKACINVLGKPRAEFICPGHPLLDATIDIVLEKYQSLLTEGAVLIDETNELTEPHLIVSLEHTISDGKVLVDGSRRIISRRTQFVTVQENELVADAGPAPFLDAKPVPAKLQAKVAPFLGTPLVADQHFADVATELAATSLAKDHRDEVYQRKKVLIDKTRAAVQERLTKEINHLDYRAVTLAEQERAGKTRNLLNSTKLRERADELRLRLQRRIQELTEEEQISAAPPVITGAALVIPRALLESNTEPDTIERIDRDRLERLAVQAVLKAEAALGHKATEMPVNNTGYDIQSHDADGRLRMIEVKGKSAGVETVTISRSQILYARNSPDQFILAICVIEPDDRVNVRYLRDPFDGELPFGAASANFELKHLLKTATAPN